MSSMLMAFVTTIVVLVVLLIGLRQAGTSAPRIASWFSFVAGTRLLLQGKYQARNRFRVSFHAPTGEAVGASDGEMATYPATEGLSSTQILAWRT